MSNLALDLIGSFRVTYCPVKMMWAHLSQQERRLEMAARLIAGDY